MSVTSWLTRRLPRRRKPHGAARPLRIERLEDRATPAVGFGDAFHVGDIHQELAMDLAADAAGNRLVTGNYATRDADGVDFDPGPGIVNRIGNPAAITPFVARYSAAGALDWVWSAGVTGGGQGKAVAFDGQGNAYATGYFNGTMDFDPDNPSPGDTLTAADSSADAFVLKLNAGGSFAWVRRIGATGQDIGEGIAVDGTGNVAVAVGSGYLARYDSQGNQLWAPPRLSATPNAVALDGAGNVHFAGSFTGSVDFDPGPGTVLLSSGGRKNSGTSAFVQKMTPGGALIWARNFATTSSSGGSTAYHVAVDTLGNVYTAGDTNGGTTDYDPGQGQHKLTGHFLSKLNASGTFVWAKVLGGHTRGLALDSAGSIYLTGHFHGTGAFGTFTLTATPTGVWDVFVVKVSSAGSFVWAVRVGGNGSDRGEGIAVDDADNVHVAGNFQETVDFDPTVSTYDLTSAGNSDFFLLLLTQS